MHLLYEASVLHDVVPIRSSVERADLCMLA